MIKRLAIGVCTLLALAACGPSNMDAQMNEAAATVSARMNEALPSAQALVNEGMATAEALANDPTAQALAATAEAMTNDPTAQALAATAEAMTNDPTVQAQANDAVATAEALANDPTAQALAATAAASVNENDVQAALDQAMQAVNEQVTLVQGQPLTLDALSGITDITNYRMTVVDAPAGAEASEGQVIKEASDGNISLTPEEYGKYFTVAGDYTVRLDITSNGQTASNEFTITVP